MWEDSIENQWRIKKKCVPSLEMNVPSSNNLNDEKKNLLHYAKARDVYRKCQYNMKFSFFIRVK